ncbi:MAG TPA: wax ester/triacylglycerol synthase family O-acyltransferase [Candidatus Binatia bacterium]|jgi:WS/DGAT/MGAT family acyltransferase
MARYSYDRLTALDNSFLILEKPNAYMHVASTMIFEAGPLATAEGGIDADAIKQVFASSLHLIPRYRQKLAYVPFTSQPVWVDDDRFNLDFHIRHSALPRPGSDVQLKRLSGRIMQQHLDRQRPLWELWIIEGLSGNRFALISKVHHCMIDGISGVDMLKILLSPYETHDVQETPQFIPRPSPSGLELIRDEVGHWARLPLEAARGVGSLIAAAEDTQRDLLTRGRAVAETLGASFRTASATPLNGEIGPHRRFDWLTMNISDIKTIRRGLGGSLNDIVLTIVTGAVRRFLQRRLVDPRRIDFRVMTPVSVRTEDERGSFGNRVSAWTVDLPVGEEDPRRQLDAIRRTTADLKSSKRAVGAEVLTQVAEWTPSTLLSLAGRNITRLLPFNMVVTNVPGPQFPMYMLGAKLLETFPHVPLVDNLGLGIALLSYDGKLCWGFNADYDLVPDLSAYVKATRESFEELREIAARSAAAAGNRAEDPARGATAKPAKPGSRAAQATPSVEVRPSNGVTHHS